MIVIVIDRAIVIAERASDDSSKRLGRYKQSSKSSKQHRKETTGRENEGAVVWMYSGGERNTKPAEG